MVCTENLQAIFVWCPLCHIQKPASLKPRSLWPRSQHEGKHKVWTWWLFQNLLTSNAYWQFRLTSPLPWWSPRGFRTTTQLCKCICIGAAGTWRPAAQNTLWMAYATWPRCAYFKKKVCDPVYPLFSTTGCVQNLNKSRSNQRWVFCTPNVSSLWVFFFFYSVLSHWVFHRLICAY